MLGSLCRWSNGSQQAVPDPKIPHLVPLSRLVVSPATRRRSFFPSQILNLGPGFLEGNDLQPGQLQVDDGFLEHVTSKSAVVF